MVKELIFRRSAAEALGIDPRTLSKYKVATPIGVIEIHGRKFEVFDKAGIDQLTKQLKDQKDQ
jgi:hypothetical protein